MKYDPYDITQGDEDLEFENSLLFGYAVLLILSFFTD